VVPYYWLLDPEERTFEGYHLADGEYRVSDRKRGNEIVRAEPFPDLTILLAELWA
jgi:Uma2 family endonuclease